MIHSLLPLLLMLLGQPASVPAGESDPASVTPAAAASDPRLTQIFESKTATGTLVLATLDGTKVLVHDAARAAKRFCPASTFKIPNSLIAMDSKALEDETQLLKWDGTKQFSPDWERDQSLTTAFLYSCVWFFQEVAKKVGMPAYHEYLKKFQYGNQAPGTDVTTFWLDDTLQISALEQIAFLQRLVKQELPVSQKAYGTLRTIMKVADVKGCDLWAKTGWALRVKHPVGWYVGYVQSGPSTWLFALNMDMEKMEQAPLRKEIVLQALRAVGICAN